MIKQLLILVLLCMGCQSNSQSLLGLPVKIHKQSGTVGELLAELDKHDGVSLVYSSSYISLGKMIQLTGREQTLEDHLTTILKDQPVKWIEQGSQVLLIFDERSAYRKKITISGFISDSKSGERLIAASVYALNRKVGTTSNSYGFFSLTLDRDSINLIISHSGHVAIPLSFFPQEDTVVQLSVEQHVVVNEIVVVNADARRNTQNRTVPGKMSVPVSMIKSMPALAGEFDVMKTLQLLPGIQAANEGSSGLNIRGGSADQNLVLLDGVPVYNATHAFGMFSVFNADAVHNVDVLKSGIPASYGGRLSSVVDVQLKEGDRYKFHGEGGIGLVFSRLTLEGPIKKGVSSFLISGRRTYLDLFARPIIKATSEDNYDVFGAFSDINFKTNFKLGEKDHLYVGVYTGIDRFFSKDEFNFFWYPDPRLRSVNTYGFSWGNNTAMVRWNHVFSKKMFANLTLNYSRFQFKASDNTETYDTLNRQVQHGEHKYFSSIKDVNVKYDIDFLPNPNHFIKMGAVATLHHYRPGVNHYYIKDSIVKLDLNIDNQSVYTGEYDAYVEDDIRLPGNMKMNVGLRFTGLSAKNNFFFSIQPRLSWLYKMNNRWSLRASAVKLNQYLHLLTNSSLGLPTDLWVPVTKKLPPQVSYQFSSGVAYSYENSIEASMEVYYKNLRNVIEYSEGAGFTNSYTDWENVVESGKGWTYGAEWLVQKKKGKITGLASYTLSWSQRKFDNINGGKIFPYKYDRRHEAKLALVWQPSKRFEMSCDWIFATGNSISLPKFQYYNPANNRFVDVYTGRNDFRMPSYHRMDIALKMTKQKKRHQRSWVLSVYNVYAQRNPFFIYKEATSVSAEFRKITLLPIIPSFSYQFKF
ncbi:MAG TPA: TonB-dependent receptor plug domain-containing protein [Chitinophagaceae bacterium]|jgi:outer membrane receptor for ferrienterochelin and colicin|nr:TonB-dependent receptor plug domain-containing protein [Chitinophagaceae bacterium]